MFSSVPMPLQALNTFSARSTSFGRTPFAAAFAIGVSVGTIVLIFARSSAPYARACFAMSAAASAFFCCSAVSVSVTFALIVVGIGVTYWVIAVSTALPTVVIEVAKVPDAAWIALTCFDATSPAWLPPLTPSAAMFAVVDAMVPASEVRAPSQTPISSSSTVWWKRESSWRLPARYSSAVFFCIGWSDGIPSITPCSHVA